MEAHRFYYTYFISVHRCSSVVELNSYGLAKENLTTFYKTIS
jgi:hypothetical protein